MLARLVEAKVIVEGHGAKNAGFGDVEVGRDDTHGLFGDIPKALLDFLQRGENQFLRFLIVTRSEVLFHHVAHPLEVNVLTGQFEHCGAPACWRRSPMIAAPWRRRDGPIWASC